MTSPGYDVSLVIPAFNSAVYLDRNVQRVTEFFSAAGLHGEVVVADDGSTDGTPDSIGPSPAVRVLRLQHRGKGAALRAGMAVATGRIRAFTDADLPYGMDQLPLAISYIRDRGFHAVTGDRKLPGSVSGDTGACDVRSRTPNDPRCASWPSITTPQTIPGIFVSVP